MSETRVLGPEHRDRMWTDALGWTFEWDGEKFWHCYRPDGTLADDMIEEALNESYSDSKYGPFREISSLWECWVAHDYDKKVFGLFPSEIEALRFAVDWNDYHLRVKRVRPGRVDEQLP